MPQNNFPSSINTKFCNFISNKVSVILIWNSYFIVNTYNILILREKTTLVKRIEIFENETINIS